MFHTLTNIQNKKAVSLWHPLDNRGGAMCVALRSLTYTIGWYNVTKTETFSWQNSESSASGLVEIPPGLYSFESLRGLLMQDNSGVSLEVNRENGLASLVVPLSISIKFSPRLLNLLGFDVGEKWLGPGSYVGSQHVNLALTTALFIHLDELSTIHNMVDGAPSSLLGVVSLGCEAFGENATIYIPTPEYRRLIQDYITELSISVRDAEGHKINNHDLPISLSLEVIVNQKS